MIENPNSVRGGLNADGTRWYGAANHRLLSLDSGVVIADLFDETGQFYRTAPVADCRDAMSARRFCSERLKNGDNVKISADQVLPDGGVVGASAGGPAGQSGSGGADDVPLAADRPTDRGGARR